MQAFTPAFRGMTPFDLKHLESFLVTVVAKEGSNILAKTSTSSSVLLLPSLLPSQCKYVKRMAKITLKSDCPPPLILLPLCVMTMLCGAAYIFL